MTTSDQHNGTLYQYVINITSLWVSLWVCGEKENTGGAAFLKKNVFSYRQILLNNDHWSTVWGEEEIMIN